MPVFPITAWDDAYANPPHIPGGETWPQRWVEAAAAFRQAHPGRCDISYGSHERMALDIFAPDAPTGLLVFVHGGFWMRLDKSVFSHLAAGALAHGRAVAVPSYVLTPEARVSEITRQIGDAVTTAASEVDGPIVLAGHSAGGHLVTRMMCEDSPLSPQVRERLSGVVSISGLHDLRPLTRLSMNGTIGLTEEEAEAESPALKRPLEGIALTCWVGGAERDAFVRQNSILANLWHGLGAPVREVVQPDRHHFSVIDGLADPQHPLARLAAGLD